LQVPDVGGVEDGGGSGEGNGHNDSDLKLDVDLDLEEELIDRLLKNVYVICIITVLFLI